MELAKQVSSLELSKKVERPRSQTKKFLVLYPQSEQEFLGCSLKTDITEHEIAHPMVEPAGEALVDCYSAFTVTELEDLLSEYEKKRLSLIDRADTEADARTKMLIFLLEERLYGKYTTEKFAQSDRRDDD